MVRFERRLEPGSVSGYVAGVGADLFLLVLVNDSIRFDGFQVFHNRDVRKLREEPRSRRHRRPVRNPAAWCGRCRR